MPASARLMARAVYVAYRLDGAAARDVRREKGRARRKDEDGHFEPRSRSSAASLAAGDGDAVRPQPSSLCHRHRAVAVGVGLAQVPQSGSPAAAADLTIIVLQTAEVYLRPGAFVLVSHVFAFRFRQLQNSSIRQDEERPLCVPVNSA